jgi:putative sporulation protein YtaF
MTAIAISMLVGSHLATYLDPHMASRIGAILIIFLGFWISIQRAGDNATADNPTIFSINLRPLGIIIQILKHPEKADFDLSGTISAKESLYLGLALAMDSLGIGLGAALAGYPVFLTVAATGVVNFLMISLGLRTGRCVPHTQVNHLTACISGLILIGIGILRML